MDLAHAHLDSSYQLDDRYMRQRGRVFLSGTQALVRLLLTQSRLDRAAGLRTAGFVSGYRGSPLAGVDRALWQAARHLEAAGIRFQPGINEALAATAVFGSQQVESDPQRRVDGVFAMWYGKGPGVDGAGDAIKHGNAYGSSPHGGVLLVAGDDHGAVSSTISHQSDHTLAAWSLPVLNPSSIADYLELGLYGWALSRFCGAWVGFKAIAETVEGAASVALPRQLPRFEQPGDFAPPPDGLHLRPVDPPSLAIERRLEAKLAAARAFARANSVDRLTVETPDARLGIVTVGKAHGDLLDALRALGLTTPEAIAGQGLRILQVRQSYPLEPQGMRRFALGLERLLVLEEKRPFVELQVKELLYNLPHGRRPTVLGKTDAEGATLLPSAAELRPHLIAPLLADLLHRQARRPGIASRGASSPETQPPETPPDEPRRVPWYCPGCPHNTGTRVPEGSVAAGGIGCHIMATWMPDRPTFGTTQMGGEGAQWTGHAPFTDRPHIFQNLGDGTFFHSGHLAIRQAVAAGTRITFKILYNDAVAMTGGQPHDGPLSVPRITRQVFEEGVRRIALVSDEPDKHAARDLAPGVTVHHRSELDAVQRELREHPGVSVLVYDQTCAAEKRRRRKKGTYPDPQRRVFINELVCEGCGDCSRTSNCLSVVPLPTELGTKRSIDQSSCNKDYSCAEGFCPSFVTVEGVGLRRRGIGPDDPALVAALAALPEPEPAYGRACNMLVAGIGGTGVLTVGAVAGIAGHLEGSEVTVLDFTGLAQKGGAVLSHLRLAVPGTVIGSSRIEPGEADLVLACDLVVGAGAEVRSLLRPGTGQVIANGDLHPTADFIRASGRTVASRERVHALAAVADAGRIEVVDATRLAMLATGDAIGANMLLLGAAWQKGLVPVGLAAIDRAIELNGVAVDANRLVFAIGRLAVHDPQATARLLGAPVHAPEPEEPPLDVLVARRHAFLEAYQDKAWAERYASLVAEVEAAEGRLGRRPRDGLARAVATSLFRLMSYKDEYEVARLYTEGTFTRRLRETFADGGRVFVHLAPPLLARPGSDGRPRKIRFGPWMLRAMRLLRHGKHLRGTALDPFGRTAERRVERALIGEYEALVRQLLAGLRPDNHADAVRIAALADGIRGFGPVKTASLERYRRELTRLLGEFLHAPTMPVAAE